MATEFKSNSRAVVELPPAIRSFLEGIQSGSWDGIEQCYAPRARYDASEPQWRYQYEGPARIAQELRGWTARHPWRFVELHCTPTADGFVVDFDARGWAPAQPDGKTQEEGVRLANIFRLEDGHIAEHRVYCCGYYDEDVLRRIEAEAPALRRTAEERR